MDDGAVASSPSHGQSVHAADALLEASPDAVLVVDGSGTILHCTRAVQELFGYHREELLGRPIEVLVPEGVGPAHAGHRARYMVEAAARPMGVGLELYGRRKDGSTVPVDIALAPLGGSQDGADARVAAFVRDASEARRTQTLLADVNQISAELLAGRPVPGILGQLATKARALVNAACSWVVVPTGDGRLAVAAADSADNVELVGASVSEIGSHSGRAMSTGAPITIPDLSDDPAVLPEAQGLNLGPGLYLPMVAEQGPVGALVVARSRGASPFTASEAAAAQLFASAAGVVLALGRARTDLEELELASEHERIARDLHDTVIQRLFAIGMGLQSVQRLAPASVGDRIEAAVDAIDTVIRDIRETIFDLNRASDVHHDLRQRVAEITHDAADQLGFAPSVTYRGPVETVLDEPRLTQMLAVLREALSNAARHAEARSVQVSVTVDEAFIVLLVADDGIGMPGDGEMTAVTAGASATGASRSGGRGLGNMADRARQLGGRLVIRPGEERGTVVEWRIPA